MLALIFLIWKIISFFVTFISPQLIPYLGSFAYTKDLSAYHLPNFISAWANFDGLYYLRIAQEGYQQYEEVFFPLYPVLIRLLSPLFWGNQLLAGLFISNLAFFLAIALFGDFLKICKQKNYFLAPIILIIFPTAFFFGAVYTESVFLLLVVLTFLLLKKQSIILAGVAAYFAALTRLMGVFLFIPLVLTVLTNKKPALWFNFLIPLLPLLGLLTYMLFLFQTTADPLAFFHGQAVFGEARSTSFVLLPQVYFRYLKIFLTASWSFQYFVALLEFCTFSAVFIVLLFDLKARIKQRDYLLLSLNLFSLINILLPTVTGSFMSLPRFALLSLSFFIALSQIKNRFALGLVSLFFVIWQIVLASFFIQGYFVS